MAIKDSLKNVAGDLNNVYTGLQNNTLPQWQGLRDQMYDYYTQQQAPYTNAMSGIFNDPSKQGYSPETVNAMRGNATGAIAGANRSAQENVRKNIAASGMGNTGMATRMASRMGRDTMAQQRTANRDVDLAQAEAQRNDKWNAAQGWQTGLNMGTNMFNQQMNATQGQQNTYNSMANVLNAKTGALTGAHNVSFWGPNPISTQITGALLNPGTYGGGG